MVRFARHDKRDSNEAECIAAALLFGSCKPIRGAKGTPDLVGALHDGRAYVAEVKMPGQVAKRISKAQAAKNYGLDDVQAEWRREWCGPYFIFTSAEDVISQLTEFREIGWRQMQILRAAREGMDAR